MSFIERRARIALVGLGLLAACTAPPPEPATKPSPAPAPEPAAAPKPAATPPVPAMITLPPPGPVRNFAEVRLQAARRLVAANPTRTYTSVPPEALLAIPVLEIELNGDGSVRKIEILRSPSQASDTIQIAAEAIRRASPFGDVSKLPKPWRFTETFLFNDDRKFKPRTLDH